MTIALSPHHDGSALYVRRRAVELNDIVTVRVRVPASSRFDEVALRYVHDGEQGVSPAKCVEVTDGVSTWESTFPQVNPVVPYRFLLSRNGEPRWWLNGTGIHDCEVPDSDDFISRIGSSGPDWATRSVVYQIFPDRFATTGVNMPPPAWARTRTWDQLPEGPDWSSELFGGDLYGVIDHLDHIETLGANVLYFTPFFPADSSHRYDANSFDEVDPLLGGDTALEQLSKEARARSMKVLGDFTLNHCGRNHGWFGAAESSPTAAEREFFYFEQQPDGSEMPATWLGVHSLMKLNLESRELRDRVYGSPTSVVRRMLGNHGPLDGWRIDVANMAGRRGAHDVSHAVSREFTDACAATDPDALVVGEHFQDSRTDQTLGGWHGVMAYMAFTRPVWSWLRADSMPPEFPDHYLGLTGSVPRRDGHATVATMRQFTAGVPFDSVLRSWLILDSHDTPRFSVVAGDPARTRVGVGMQMTMPGTPMVWMGDEIGLGGTSCGEDSRRPMPWDRTDTWDHDLFAWYRELIAMRRSQQPLATGSMRFVHVDADVIAFVRETDDDALLCVARRAPGAEVRLPRDAVGASMCESLVGNSVSMDADDIVIHAGGTGFHIAIIKQHTRGTRHG